MRHYIICFLLFSFSLNFVKAQSYQKLILQSADFIEKNQLDSAEVSLRRALSLDPANADNAALLMSLGALQRQLGKMEDAYISFTAALNSYPDSKIVLHNRGALLTDMNKHAEAFQDYSEIIRLDPSDVQAYYRRGLLLLDEKKRTEAERDFQKAWQLEPANFYSLLSKALMYKIDNRWEDAAQIYTQLIDNEKKNLTKLYLNRAECYVNMEKMPIAMADLQVAEKGEKDNPYFYFLRGRVRLAQYDTIAAKADFEKAKNLGYDSEVCDIWIKRSK